MNLNLIEIRASVNQMFRYYLFFHQPQQILIEQWKNLLKFDICLKDNNSFGQSFRQQGSFFSKDSIDIKYLSFRLTSQCEKHDEELYSDLQEKSFH